MAYKKFNNEEEHIQFLLPILARYRLFIQGYYNITRMQVLEYISTKLNKPVEECHFDKLSYEDICKVFNIFKNINQSIIGKRKLPIKGNIKKYGEKLRQEKLNS